MYGATLGYRRYNFSNLATLLAKASPLRSGDILAGIAAQSGEERAAAQFALADLPLRTFLEDHLIAYESDDITRLINAKAFAAISHLTVGGFRDWLLSDDATHNVLGDVAPGVTPEMAAAVSVQPAVAGSGRTAMRQRKRGVPSPAQADAGARLDRTAPRRRNWR
jgi:ethanolamine ammonia-lyase large subunit